jgi:hypothetical protein
MEPHLTESPTSRDVDSFYMQIARGLSPANIRVDRKTPYPMLHARATFGSQEVAMVPMVDRREILYMKVYRGLVRGLSVLCVCFFF